MEKEVYGARAVRRVRVLLAEDEAEKCQRISDELHQFFGEALVLDVSEDFGSATRNILQQSYDFIVVDLLMPRRSGELPVDVADELADNLMASEKNRLTVTVAISRFEHLIDARRSQFSRAGILLISYRDEEAWKSCLQICMQRVAANTFYDFVIVCGLREERNAYSDVGQSELTVGETLRVGGLDAREITLGDLHGVCVLQPRMGLVDASVVAAKALEIFSPRLICMSGVCGGFSGKTALGSLVVSELTWEHQAGKWRGDHFELRSYQEPLDDDVRTKLSQLIDEDPNLSRLATRPGRTSLPTEIADLQPTVSGSAVIASDQYAGEIAKQHGKLAAVDMEVFGIYRAARLYAKPVAFFAAKTVVDMAGETKNDDLHEKGAVLSARFTVCAIKRILG